MSKEKVLPYFEHGCWYTMQDNDLLYKHDEDEEWILVDMDFCLAHGINHYEVYQYFGKEDYYINVLGGNDE